MSDTSAIEWTDATWNPVTGCAKVSQGCKNCYALREWPRLSAPRPQPNVYTGRAFTDVMCHPERLEQPLRWKKPRRIFVNSMSDLFHEDVPDEFILKVFDIIRQHHNGFSMALNRLLPSHTFQVLTKRPERMLDFCRRVRLDNGTGLNLVAYPEARGFNPLPAFKRLWLGVSVEDQATANERAPLLMQTPAAVRFFSCEPLLGSIDMAEVYQQPVFNMAGPIHWVIAGGESGPKARPSHPEWFRKLRDQCQALGVPFFFKQWGEWAPGEVGPPMTRTEQVAWWWPESWQHGTLTLRQSQEMHRDDGPDVHRFGKRAAGRLLDGRTWDEFPR